MDRRTFFYEFIYGLFVLALILTYPLLVLLGLVHSFGKCLKNWLSPKSISGEVALITGSGRGLGKCIAAELAKRGCHLAIVDIQGQLAVETAGLLAKTYSVKTKAYKVDVTDFRQLEELRERVSKDLGDVTILINNAGIIVPSCHINPTADEVERMIGVNFKAMQFTTQLFLPKMQELNRGHIVNISSMAACLPCPLVGLYGATKAAVRSLTSSLRVHLLQCNSNIKATTMLPTFLNTNERVNQLVDQLNAYMLGPRVDGDYMAQCVVKSMLRGDSEVAVPCALYAVQWMFGIVPVYIEEMISSILTQPLAKKIERHDVKLTLRTVDINANL